MHITIDKTLLTGNMGEEWSDPVTACHAYAAFLRTTWTEHVQRLYPRATIECDIRVRRGSGYEPGVAVGVEYASDEDHRPAWELQNGLERLLSDLAWDTWDTFMHLPTTQAIIG